MTTVYGSDEARKALLGQVRQVDDWAPLLDERFLQRGAYLVPEGEFDWRRAARFTPTLPAPTTRPRWHPEDALFAPMRDPEGELLGVLSVDEPLSGRRPTATRSTCSSPCPSMRRLPCSRRRRRAREGEPRRARTAARRVGAPERDVRHTRAARARLLRDLGGTRFERVAVQLLSDSGRHETAAAVGFGAGENLGKPLTADQLERLLQPEFDVSGCFLIPEDAAHQLIPDRGPGYRSQRDGRGPHAWSNHWLFVPLYDRRQRRIGYIWTDDPTDRLVPTRSGCRSCARSRISRPPRSTRHRVRGAAGFERALPRTDRRVAGRDHRVRLRRARALVEQRSDPDVRLVGGRDDRPA